MANLTDLVPPLELCKKIPTGEFADSALVWVSEDLGVVPASMIDRELYDIPAPTLEEIMAAMPFCRVYKKVNGVFIAVHEKTRIAHMNAADAALKLWLKLKGIENGK